MDLIERKALVDAYRDELKTDGGSGGRFKTRSALLAHLRGKVGRKTPASAATLRPRASDRTAGGYNNRIDNADPDSAWGGDGGIGESARRWDNFRASRPRLPRSERDPGGYVGYNGTKPGKRMRRQARRFRSR